MTENEELYLSSSSIEDSWVSQFCEMANHQYFCEVSESFMEDEFNLTGLNSLVPRYKEALELILDLEPEVPVPLPEIPTIEESGELLYGLIHARFIITRPGLQSMAYKYACRDFGTCPRYQCRNTAVLPMGRLDIPGFETVRLYCPCCRDIYVPSNSRFLNIDGAFFGSSFPAFFLETYPKVEQECRRIREQSPPFQLKIFGFNIAEKSRAGPRMKWLRQTPGQDKSQGPQETEAATAIEEEAVVG
ncbi:Casein kinase II subunit beta [Wickerhamiella sorbophila]|uniref:Casein kinase II subunit beta n=1 Tax=Wickerhamiella sorbophila TaxID=45607 RepID=A0A2T0FM97_9ASCO|nr:Casein kinase II subunit beta [Wickerhamiella sorbophila]PRT56105.1 Casein kinase II subunit beta [Wickerhamiella sorbophila]